MENDMSETERDADEAARLERYLAERTRAQARTIRASIAARFRAADPARCEAGYRVADR